MRIQTGYFLQALAEGGVSSEQILHIFKKTILQELENNLPALRNPETLWISDVAVSARNEYLQLEKDVNKITNPSRITRFIERMQKIQGKIQGLQIVTIQSLNSPKGPSIDKLHILVPQLFPLAQKQLKRKTEIQMFRLCVFGGLDKMKDIHAISSQSVSEQIHFLYDVMDIKINSLGDALDGRWAYERRKIRICRKYIVEQYMSVPVTQEELLQVPGNYRIGTGSNGVVRISGRGNITNLSPAGLTEADIADIRTRISTQGFFQLTDLLKKTPDQVLNLCLKGEPYIIEPGEIFRLYNQYLISHTMFFRFRRGNCLFCGGVVINNRCTECGENI